MVQNISSSDSSLAGRATIPGRNDFHLVLNNSFRWIWDDAEVVPTKLPPSGYNVLTLLLEILWPISHSTNDLKLSKCTVHVAVEVCVNYYSVDLLECRIALPISSKLGSFLYGSRWETVLGMEQVLRAL